jgi:hypothetical protein
MKPRYLVVTNTLLQMNVFVQKPGTSPSVILHCMYKLRWKMLNMCKRSLTKK